MIPPIDRTVLINATPSVVWNYLTLPELMQQWIGPPEMEIEVNTDWKIGSPMIIRGFHHVGFENRGVVQAFDLHKQIRYTQLSTISRMPDLPENYTVVEFTLTLVQNETLLALKIWNFPTETIFRHLDFYWRGTLEIMKKLIEKQNLQTKI